MERCATSLGGVLDAVRAIEAEWGSDPDAGRELWFRGVPKKTHGLLPGLYRPLMGGGFYDEADLFEWFKAQGASFAPSTVRSDWDWYVLAQHHRLPTRLLDWTENVLAAVYFSLVGLLETTDRRSYDLRRLSTRLPPIYDDNSPVVWVLEPASLNAYGATPGDEYVFAPGGERTLEYLPNRIGAATDANRFPVAITPPRTNARILAQRGVLTVHGHDERPIDAIAALPSSTVQLARVVLDRANLAHIQSELEFAGIDRLALFPDLDAVSFLAAWTGQRYKG